MQLSNYESIILLHSEKARELLKVLDSEGEKAAMDRLKALHEPGEGTMVSTRGAPWNDGDTVFEDDGYVMYYNRVAGYVGLVFRLEIPPDTV
ncbi:MAG: hypothetical protein R3174_07695 [Gammaproteobacteria bacterium]|nr:hypothetical protein [Gammaproteobacteria bacterium]